MKYIAFLSAFLFASAACAAEIIINWDAIPNASGYRVYQSVDLGATWQQVAEVATLPVTVSNVPDAGLVLFRAAAFNSADEAVRTETGFFYNGDWSPLAPPANMGTP